MSARATGQFDITSWDEDSYDTFGDEAGLSRATVAQEFTGDIAGEGAVMYLMTYTDESNARFVGQQHITGRLDGREGSFVLHLEGTYDGSQVEATWAVVPGSATGDLSGLRGQGRFSAALGKTASYELDYQLK